MKGMSKIAAQMKKLVLLSLLTSCCVYLWGEDQFCPPSGARGRWSTAATDLCKPTPGWKSKPWRDYRIQSPGGRASVHVLDNSWWIEVGGKQIKPRDKYIQDYAEVSWSPLGDAFFISESDGFTTGFHTRIYFLKNKELVQVSGISKLVTVQFEVHHRCKYIYEGTDMGNKPNVVGMQWLDRSGRLLLVAEVLPLGICNEGTYFAGYEVNLKDRKIINTESPEDLTRNGKELLGWRLLSDYDQLSLSKRAQKP